MAVRCNLMKKCFVSCQFHEKNRRSNIALTSRSGIDIEIPRSGVTIHAPPVERLGTLRTDEHGCPRGGSEAAPAHPRHTSCAA